MTNLDLDLLATVTGGAGAQQNPAVCYPKPPEQSLTNISPGVRENQATQAGVERYNKFYDNYTGLIDNMNGIGGGAAVAGGATPSPSLGF
ncbi:MAG TPA: hypothetical protein VGC41_13515 [Kofleriaceae bacterium]